MTLREKLALSCYSTRQCRRCGVSLGVEQTGAGWFFFGWIPISISGLLPLPFKVVLGCIGIGLIMLPFIYLIPLVEKSEKIGEKKLPQWLLPWLAILTIGAFASDWVNLLPSNGTKIVALVVSVFLTIPVVLTLPRRSQNVDFEKLGLAVLGVFVVGLHYFALSNLPPALLTLVAGEQMVVEAKIVHKSHSNKLTRCSNKVEILITGEDQKHRICLPAESWNTVKKGDQVFVTSLNTGYGRLITTVAPATQSEHGKDNFNLQRPQLGEAAIST